jgi:hypothetical protein
MYRAVEARVIASLKPFLPGALMAPALIILHGRMQYLVNSGKGRCWFAQQGPGTFECQVDSGNNRRARLGIAINLRSDVTAVN